VNRSHHTLSRTLLLYCGIVQESSISWKKQQNLLLMVAMGTYASHLSSRRLLYAHCRKFTKAEIILFEMGGGAG